MVIISTRHENIEKVRLLEDKLFAMDAMGWLEYEFLTWEWWLLLSFFISPWILWIIIKKRKWLVESILFGVIVLVITILLDTVGLQFSFWEYPIEFLPVITRAFPFDVSMVPVAYICFSNMPEHGNHLFQPKSSWLLHMLLLGNPYVNGLTLFAILNGITFIPSYITFFLDLELEHLF